MKQNLLAKNLESFNNFNIYSKTYSEYEKVLGNFTLKSFIKSLKNPKNIKKTKFIEEMALKYPTDEDDDSYSSKKKNKFNNFYNLLDTEYIQSTNKNKKSNKGNLTLINKKPIIVDITPNPCTYNPKYDIIFKRIPVTTIYNTPNKIEKIKGNNSSIKRAIKLKNIGKELTNNNILSYQNNKRRIKKIRLGELGLFNKNNLLLHKKDNFNKENKKNEKVKMNNITKTEAINNNFIKTEICEDKKDREKQNKKDINKLLINIINPTLNNRRNNLSNFFKKNYFSTNSKNNSILKTNITNISNEENNNSREIKNVVDFRKMTKRNFEIILNNSSLKNPSFYRYNPKFDFVTQTSKAFHFGSKNNRTNLEKKKFMLKKTWCSYLDISKDYYLINNSKLKENKEI